MFKFIKWCKTGIPKRKIKKEFKKEKATEVNIKNTEMKSFLLMYFLWAVAFFFIRISFVCSESVGNLMLSLGTGAATSALVSRIFYTNEKLTDKRERLNNRIVFMKDFKNLYYDIINTIGFEKNCNVTIDIEIYIKNQHRWYHDYYKRIIAGSDTNEETELRIRQLKTFMLLNKIRFNECFEYNVGWKNGAYSDWQHKELSWFFNGFKNIEVYIEQKAYEYAFLEFAYFLECIKRMFEDFVELENFKLLSFVYNDKGALEINRMEFEKKETEFKFKREFNEIRRNNYIQYFSKNNLE